jgi:hypothetical protein
MAIRPHTVQVPGGLPVVIYAETPNINYFINGSLEPDGADGVTNDQADVSSSTRQQYPGDPTPINVSGSSHEYLIDPTRKSGNGLPGKSFVLAAYNQQGELTEKRQFTYKGRWIDLHAFLSAEVSFQTFAFNHTGARYTMASTVAPQV